MPRRPFPWYSLLPVLAGAGCAVRPSAIPASAWLVLVKSVRLPERGWLPWYARFAEHAWVDVGTPAGWYRVEWNAHLDAVRVEPIDDRFVNLDQRWERGVAVHDWYSGAAAERIGKAILQVAAQYPDARSYGAWPGPNSNTFVEWLSHQVPGFAMQLPPNAVGKDYTPWLHAGVTSTRTGLEVETIVLGAQVGLCEGAELHVLGLTLGVGLWPPQLKLPFLPAFPGGWFSPFGAAGAATDTQGERQQSGR